LGAESGGGVEGKMEGRGERRFMGKYR